MMFVPALAALVLAAATPAVAEGIAGQFDFYVLTLDWEPRDCPGDDPAALACAPGDHAFVYHALWPRLEMAEPTSCLTMVSPELTAPALSPIAAFMPRARMVQEWDLHGVCAGLRVQDYITLTRDAITNLAIPSDFVRPNFAERLTPRQIEDAFIAVNSGLSPEAMAVQCRRGDFTGIKLCLAKDLAFRPCEEIDAGGCQGESLAVALTP